MSNKFQDFENKTKQFLDDLQKNNKSGSEFDLKVFGSLMKQKKDLEQEAKIIKKETGISPWGLKKGAFADLNNPEKIELWKLEEKKGNKKTFVEYGVKLVWIFVIVLFLINIPYTLFLTPFLFIIYLFYRDEIDDYFKRVFK